MENERARNADQYIVTPLKIRLKVESEVSRRFFLQFTAYKYREMIEKINNELGLYKNLEGQNQDPKKIN